MRFAPRFLGLTTAVLLALAALRADAQSTVPLRQTGPALATTVEPLGLLLGARPMRDGRVLVNDGGSRRLLLYDATLAKRTVVADSAGSTGLPYGNVATPMAAYPGDSTLFLDRIARGFVVIDPNGKQARVAALPKAGDQLWIGSAKSVADPAGRLVYRGGGISNAVKDTGQPVFVIRFAQEAPIVRANFATRLVDTAGRIHWPVPQENHNERQPNGGPSHQTVFTFGLALVDDWTMLPDGTIAIVRAQDYHIDWVAMDGKMTSTAKMPFDWQRVDDDEKRRIADSAAKETQKFIESQRALPPPPPRADGSIPERTIAGRTDPLTGAILIMAIDAVVKPAPVERIPDFHQPFRVGSTFADAQGNVWILPVTTTYARNGGLVYDVATRAGVLAERVELPPGRSLVAIGPDDTLYLTYKEGDVWKLEKRKVQR